MLNKVILMGRLTKDPEIRYTSDNNVPVTRFSLAINRRFSKPGEEKQADFINCIAWNKTAEFVNNYFTKGKMMVVTGRIQTGSYDGQDGKKIYTTDVVAEEVTFGESKSDGSNRANNTTDSTSNNEGFFPVESDDELPF